MMYFRKFAPSLVLQPYIESLLVQEDFNPTNYANRNPVKVLPTTMPVMGIQYGQPMKRLENGQGIAMGSSGITGMQATVKEYLSTGAIGTIITTFKPGGLSRFTRYPVHEFRNLNVPLELIFPAGLVRDMEEKLLYAEGPAERIGIVQQFLASLLHDDREEDRLIVQTARQLAVLRGMISIESLAAQSYMSKRTLERKFNAVIGASPKQFAGIVRFQHTIQLRNAGFRYLDIVEACGYSDHAHFAKDFKAYAGCSPEKFFHSEFQPELKKTFNGGEDPSHPNQKLYF